MKNSPTPWDVEYDGDEIEIVDASGETVAVLDDPEGNPVMAEDALLIVTAVNNLGRVTAERDALKSACETLLAYDRETSPPAERFMLALAIQQARTALKACEVQQ